MKEVDDIVKEIEEIKEHGDGNWFKELCEEKIEEFKARAKWLERDIESFRTYMRNV